VAIEGYLQYERVVCVRNLSPFPLATALFIGDVSTTFTYLIRFAYSRCENSIHTYNKAQHKKKNCQRLTQYRRRLHAQTTTVLSHWRRIAKHNDSESRRVVNLQCNALNEQHQVINKYTVTKLKLSIWCWPFAQVKELKLDTWAGAWELKTCRHEHNFLGLKIPI